MMYVDSTMPREISHPPPNMILGFHARTEIRNGRRVLQLCNQDKLVLQVDFAAKWNQSRISILGVMLEDKYCGTTVKSESRKFIVRFMEVRFIRVGGNGLELSNLNDFVGQDP